MKNLPDTIIIRYDDKYDSEVKYQRQYLDYFCFYRKQGKQYLMKSNSEQELWAAIKRLYELWLEKDKIFFEVRKTIDKGKNNLKGTEKTLFLDAENMLKFINN
jgi:hypothetical protein